MEELVAGTALGGRYELDEMVGSGGMAAVWRAHDRVLDRHVAVKILHARLAEDPAFLERFRAEATAAARLTHPNIVHVFDAGADDDTAFIVMELFEGETLRERLQRTGPLAPGDAASVMIQALHGLQFAHDHGLIHRDVKPANVLVAPDGRVKVTDFGIAKAAYGGTDDPTTTGKVLGSVPYLAPEQVEGKPLDGRADEYAAGAMLYELLTGRPPFTAETDLAAAMVRLTSDPIPPRAVRSGIPKGVDAVVMRALARDPDARFPTAAAMAAALVPYEAGAAEGLDHPDEVEPAPRGSFRSWMVVPLLAILTAAVVIVIAVAAGVINSPLSDGGPSRGTSASGGGSTSAGGSGGSVIPFAAPPVAYDPPPGDGAEHDSDLPLAVDGDPSTWWETEGYHSPTLDKPGVGIAFDLGHPATVTGFHLVTPLPGWSFQIKVGDSLDQAEAASPVLTAEQNMRGTITPATGRYVLVWITKVVPAPDGENRAEVAEFSVTGSR